MIWKWNNHVQWNLTLHLTSKKTSQFQSPWLSPKLYSTLQITSCNKVTSTLRSLLPSPVGDLNSEVPLYFLFRCKGEKSLYQIMNNITATDRLRCLRWPSGGRSPGSSRSSQRWSSSGTSGDRTSLSVWWASSNSRRSPPPSVTRCSSKPAAGGSTSLMH